MSRRRRQKKRSYVIDPIYQSVLVHKIANCLIISGKKSLSYRILYSSLSQIQEKTQTDPLVVLEHAIYMVTPTVQLKSRRIGGATYQVPQEVSPYRGLVMATQWMLAAAKSRSGRSVVTKLSMEILDAIRDTGGAISKRQEMQRIAEANKAFTRYRFSR